MICKLYIGPRGSGVIFAQSHNQAAATVAALESGDAIEIGKHGFRCVYFTEPPEEFKAAVLAAVEHCDAPSPEALL